MFGNELIHRAFNLEVIDRILWLPFVVVHAGRLIDVNAKESLQSSLLIFNGVKAAIDVYKTDGISFAFDLQIEAEALGSHLIADELKNIIEYDS